MKDLVLILLPFVAVILCLCALLRRTNICLGPQPTLSTPPSSH